MDTKEGRSAGLRHGSFTRGLMAIGKSPGPRGQECRRYVAPGFSNLWVDGTFQFRVILTPLFLRCLLLSRQFPQRFLKFLAKFQTTAQITFNTSWPTSWNPSLFPINGKSPVPMNGGRRLITSS